MFKIFINLDLQFTGYDFFPFLVQFFCHSHSESCNQESSISSATGYIRNHVNSMADPLTGDFHPSFIDPGPYVIMVDSSFHNSIISGESDIPMPPPPYSEQEQVSLDPPPEYSSNRDWLSSFCKQKHACLLIGYDNFYVCVVGVTCKCIDGLRWKAVRSFLFNC